jgi:multidrug efflux system membrane fusion protein
MDTPRSPGRRFPWKTILVVAVVAVGGYIGWQRYENSQAQQAAAAKAQAKGPPAVPVSTAKVGKADFPVYIEGLGTVQAFNTVTVRSRVDGQIEKMAVNEGQDVKAGDLIVQIDPRSFQAALEQAQAKKLQDQANLKNANLDLGRYAQLSKQDFATGQQLDTQKATVNQLTAQIASDQAAIDSAQVQLSYATITAPISGRTGLRFVDEGNIVHATDTTGIISIQQIQPISVVFTAPQELVSNINKAQAVAPLKVIALSSDHSQVLSEGTLTVVNNQIDAATGTIQLKATFENKDGALWPGLSVATRLLLDTLHDVVTVPTDAVQHGPDGLFAYTVGDDKIVHIAKIKVDHDGDGNSVVANGLTPGQTVVTAGQYRLQDGVKITAGPAQTAAKD